MNASIVRLLHIATDKQSTQIPVFPKGSSSHAKWDPSCGRASKHHAETVSAGSHPQHLLQHCSCVNNIW